LENKIGKLERNLRIGSLRVVELGRDDNQFKILPNKEKSRKNKNPPGKIKKGQNFKKIIYLPWAPTSNNNPRLFEGR
jgi:hypothetical protein